MTDFDPPSAENSPEPEAVAPLPVSREASKPLSLLNALWEVVQTILLALVIFLLIRTVVQNYRVEGISMEPNFHDGQFLFVNRFAYCPGLHLDLPPLGIRWQKVVCLWEPQRGDVIVFHYPRDPDRDFIKRVIGLPGETVEVRGGKVFIDGQLMPEPFGPNPGSYSAPPVTVGPGDVYVMGDNRNNSSDSHMWGPLPQSYIVGRAWISYWPPQHWAIVPRYDLNDLSTSALTR